MTDTRLLSVGWSPQMIERLLLPAQTSMNAAFMHALVDESMNISAIQAQYRALNFLGIGLTGSEQVPPANMGLLSALEQPGVPSIRSMLRSDPYLSKLPQEDSLKYISLLAQRLIDAIRNFEPTVVLASHDRVHSAVALAVCRYLHVPFAAFLFSSLPTGRVAFTRSLSPRWLVPLNVPVNKATEAEVDEILAALADPDDANTVRVDPYADNRTLPTRRRYMGEWWSSLRRFSRRTTRPREHGCVPFAAPRPTDSVVDRLRRSINRASLPRRRFVRTPPSEPYIYCALQKQPESTIDVWSPWLSNQIELVRQIALATPVSMKLAVKLHFVDGDNYSRRTLLNLIERWGVVIVDPSAPSREFIRRASLIVGTYGTTALEGALLGKPVLAFVNTPVLRFPSVERALAPDLLATQVRRLLDASDIDASAIREAYLRYLGEFLPGTWADWSVPSSPQEILNVSAAIERLLAYAQKPEVRATWYRQPPFIEI